MLTINAARLLESIDQLAQIGALPEGGVRRLAFSEEDLQARQQVQTWMEAAGMSVRVDAAGNMIGHFAGESEEVPALATGSHIDTVPQGGKYDGAYGVLAGLEIVRVLHEQGIRLYHPFEVIVFSDEEGTLIGSKGISGTVDPDPERYRRGDGSSIQTCLERVGGNWHTISNAKRTAQDMAAFVELHIEQGPVLESNGLPIGVVEGIVGQRRFQITVKGKANHAGTTPMRMRHDALVAAAEMIVAVQQVGLLPGDQVATVGQLQVFPNAVNVVPGEVQMSLDLRDLSNQRLDQLLALLQQQISDIALRHRVEAEVKPSMQTDPAPAHPLIQQAIVDVCRSMGLSFMHLPSRASHDAQEVARITDMGMIFVPSQTGISHSAQEYTDPQQLVQGVNALLQTFLKLDQGYR